MRVSYNRNSQNASISAVSDHVAVERPPYQRCRRIRVVGGRLLFGFGDRTCGCGATFLDAARVLRVAGAAAAFGAALTRFLGTSSSSFSLSPSSDGLFFPRVVFDAGLGAGFAGAALVLRAAGAGARTGTGAGAAAASFLAGALEGAGIDASSRSMSLIFRLLLGMRLTRRSRRD